MFILSICFIVNYNYIVVLAVSLKKLYIKMLFKCKNNFDLSRHVILKEFSAPQAKNDG